jgi:glycosyltransferase involved in cell wall biosynthesis
MKILLVHDRFGAHGGAESNLFQSSLELQARGHELALVHGPSTGRSEPEWSAPAIAVETALRRFEPDIIYLHNSPGVITVEALAQARVPIVRMVHDHQMFCLRGCRYPAWSRRACTKALSSSCIFPCGGFLVKKPEGGWSVTLAAYNAKRTELELHRRFARLIVASEYMREELRRNGFSDDQIEIHAPVPRLANAPRPIDRSAQPNRIIYAGQIVRGKGVDILLKSLALVREPFASDILGDGNHREYCESLCRQLGLQDRVRFHGFMPPGEMAAFYQQATVAVVSSVWPEPFGLAGLEAMRHGLPVVAFDVGGIRAWLDDGENGLLAPWMDEEEFAVRVELLLRNRELANRLGERGRVMAEERFNFLRYIDGIEAMLARLAAPRQSAPSVPVEVAV